MYIADPVGLAAYAAFATMLVGGLMSKLKVDRQSRTVLVRMNPEQHAEVKALAARKGWSVPRMYWELLVVGLRRFPKGKS